MLRQIKVRYDALEDRLQLSLEVESRTHHLLLTRRLWAGARLALQRVLDLSAQAPASLPRSVQQSISAAHHQAVAAQTPAAHEPVQGHGVPAEAVLVTALQLGQRKTGSGDELQRSWVIQFSLHRQPELRLVLNDKTLHALVSALLQREEAAQWGLPTLPAQVALVPPVNPTLQ